MWCKLKSEFSDSPIQFKGGMDWQNLMHILNETSLSPKAFKLSCEDGVFSYSQLTMLLSE